MIFSLNWLKQYFDQPLPDFKTIENGIIFHAFEVESVEPKADDVLLDIKVLPDRAHDCLCHFGLAGEISAILNIPMRSYSADYGEIKTDLGSSGADGLTVKINSPDLCRRYLGRLVKNVKIGSSPDWLKKRLESLGQRSINNVVDATNYVMFDIGQPMHAFDADKIKGGITIRLAKKDEKIVTLDNQEVNLDESVLIIADDEGPLAIAGIKGGKKAEVTPETKNLILESANFKPVNIRRASNKIDVRTDASKRFENDLSPAVAEEAMALLSSLLAQMAVGTEQIVFGEKIDVYPKPEAERTITINPEQISQIIGLDISSSEMMAILNRLGIETQAVDDKFKLLIPARRVDLEAPENIVEEIARIIGYDKIPAKLLPADFKRSEQKDADKRFDLANKIREILAEQGFIEVYGYAFTDQGEIAVANPLAEDKVFLRTNLTDWLVDRLAFNLQNIILDSEPVKLFELGRVFKKAKDGTEETTRLGLAVAGKLKKFDSEEILTRASQAIENELNCGSLDNFDLQKNNLTNIKGQVWELSFDDLAKESNNYKLPDLSNYLSAPKEYKKVSIYPRIIRDIAVWVPAETETETVAKIIKNSAGDLCVTDPVLFDEFAKEGRKSLAFRLVFQSYTKTLADDEANAQMNQVIDTLDQQENFEVRK